MMPSVRSTLQQRKQNEAKYETDAFVHEEEEEENNDKEKLKQILSFQFVVNEKIFYCLRIVRLAQN